MNTLSRTENFNAQIWYSRNATTEVWENEYTLDARNVTARHVFIFQKTAPKKAAFVFRLAASGARAEVVVLFLGKDSMRSDIRVTLSHEAPDTYGRVLCKAALWDSSRLDFSGMLRIAKGADGSDSYLKAQALMLSEKAIARVDPQLEILANDVKASHGATVGRMRPEDMFYLQSRGLQHKAAERILLEGFFADAFSCMPERVSKMLKKSL